MLHRVRESLTLGLLALLPLHALAVTVGTKLILGPGHAPWMVLALWKEALLAVILFLALLELFLQKTSPFRGDRIDASILALIVLSFVTPSSNFILGFRYDFIPLLSFLILRRVPWSAHFFHSAIRILLCMGGLVAAYGIATLIVPDSFFAVLGYSDGHSLYLPDHPIAAFQQIGASAIRRIQSTMSGPNQLGMWLLIPWALAPIADIPKWWKWLLKAIIGLAILLTFSRAAWIAAFVIACVHVSEFSPRLRRQTFLGMGITAILGVTLVAVIAPGIILRAASNRDHLERPVIALRTMLAHPFGLGLGSAGPASNRTSDACVYLPEETKDISWAAGSPNLCVFLGTTQVQPTDHSCSCPFLPENWYLQIGVELGIVGFVLFLLMTAMVTIRLWEKERDLFALMLGVSIAALFLHAWEDTAIAFTVWILVASVLRPRTFS